MSEKKERISVSQFAERYTKLTNEQFAQLTQNIITKLY